MSRKKGGAMERIRSFRKSNTFFLLCAIILILLVGSFFSDSFIDVFNLSRLLRKTAIMGLMAIGMTFVIIGGNGGIDLSVGSIFGVGAMVAISLQNTEIVNTSGTVRLGLNLPIALIMLAVIAAGAFIGLLNGLGVTVLGISPFIMTLCMMNIARGVVLVYSGGFQFIGVREDFAMLGGGMIMERIPIALLIFLIATIAAFFTVHRTSYGRKLFAVGANKRAAHISGIRYKRVLIITYVISGILAALSGAFFTSFTMAVDPYAGNGYETDAISAVLIGGTSMAGGQGTVTGTVLGLLLISLIKNLLTHLEINTYVQQMVTAILILIVVLAQQKRHTDAEKGGNGECRKRFWK